jgi:hypothetical protein
MEGSSFRRDTYLQLTENKEDYKTKKDSVKASRATTYKA